MMEENTKALESFLEDLDVFIHLNQDDFDRGKGFTLIQNYISEKRDSALTESQSVRAKKATKENFYCDWHNDNYPEKCSYQCDVCRRDNSVVADR